MNRNNRKLDPVALAVQLHDQAVAYCGQGKHARARPLCLRSIKILESALGPKHPDVANVIHTLGTTYQLDDRHSDAEHLYLRALRIVENAARAEEVDSFHVQVLDSLAGLYRVQGRYTDAEPLYRRALALAEGAFGPDDIQLSQILNNLAVLYKYTARFAEASKLYHRALSITTKALGPKHSEVAAIYHNLGGLEAEAAEIKKRAHRIEADLETTDSPVAPDKPEIDPRYTRFRLVVRPSRIHRWGVFAGETIPADVQVIEYTGERVARQEGKRRSARELHYLFMVDKYWKLDGVVGGSGAEYINHSCEPNLFAEIKRGRVFYFSEHRIQAGEELLIDYMFSKSDECVPCHCGAKNCRGTINEK